MAYKREMRRIRAICGLLILLLVSHVSLAGQMLVLPTVAENEVSLSTPPCHQADQEAQDTMPCCVEDCGNCVMSSIFSAEQSWFASFDPDSNIKVYSPPMSDRDIGTLQRPPIFA